jgi:RNA polymerase sigma factor (sigma-70 family)
MADDLTKARTRLTDAVGRDRLRLTRFVRGKLGGAGDLDAEDILSDVVLRLFERADLLAEVENVTAYLFRALGNRVAELFRRRKEVLLHDLPPSDGAIQEGYHDDSPEIQLEQRQLRQRIHEALAQLNPAERAVWVAVEVEGWRFRELAEAWGEPLGTLLSRKNRASKALRKALATDGPSHWEIVE